MKSERLRSRIDQHKQSLTKSETVIADRLRKDGIEVAFSTAQAVSAQLGVSEATLVRFARTIGYDSYQHLQQDLQDEIRHQLSITTVERLRDNAAAGSALHEVFKSSLQRDIENLESSLNDFTDADIDAAVDALISARHVYVLGVRASAPAALFLSHSLRYVLETVRPFTLSVESYFEEMLDIGAEDALVVITLSRPSPRALQLVSFAKDRGAKIVAICDSAHSPIGQLADVALVVESESVTFIQSYTPVMSVGLALIAAVGSARHEDAERRLAAAEELIERYQLNVKW
ncbi:MAG TPA: MurR/RpiR family transcriptional regulator [Thermomicrobiales bacterium]|nr:MurR/RpiR family transcriptional regulator [Thermomicrobiales bacterium]